MSKKGSKKNGKIFGRILLAIFLILIIVIAAGIGIGLWYVKDKLNKVNYVEIPQDQIEINDEVEEKMPEVKTIAIFGVDSRDDEMAKDTRSDCIMLATIDEAKKEVHLTSVYRDTYLQITGRGLDKVTHAYAYGGPALAMSTLNTNLDLNIKQFVTVNFTSVVDIVDAVGGVTIDLTSAEVKYINQYIVENNKLTGHKASKITKAGTYNLNGVQALAYCRIRYTAGGDYKRTERMRDVLMKIAEKAKKMSIGQLNTLADKLLPEVYTNISGQEILSLIPQLIGYNIVESSGWPYNPGSATINSVWYGPPVTLQSNVVELHKKVYGQEDYEPSAKVKEISRKIINKTGVK